MMFLPPGPPARAFRCHHETRFIDRGICCCLSGCPTLAFRGWVRASWHELRISAAVIPSAGARGICCWGCLCSYGYAIEQSPSQIHRDLFGRENGFRIARRPAFTVCPAVAARSPAAGSRWCLRHNRRHPEPGRILDGGEGSAFNAPAELQPNIDLRMTRYCLPKSCRAITSRWISLVPSPMVQSFTSR